MQLVMLGLGSFLPVVVASVMAVLVLPRLATFGRPDGISQDDFFRTFHAAFATVVAVGAVAIATAIYYLWLIHRSGIVPREKRTEWTLVLAIANILALPYLWFRLKGLMQSNS